MRRLSPLLLLCVVAGCSDDDSNGSGNVPAEATSLSTYTQTGVTTLVPRLTGFEALLPTLLNPGSSGEEGFTFAPDPTPGAPANSYVFSVPVDGDGDGINETSIAGTVAFNGDPYAAGAGLGGSVTFSIETAGGLGTFVGDMDFLLTPSGRQISGTGTFTESVTGRTTQITIPPSQPLVMKAATGAGDAVANACGYSLDGNVDVLTTGASGGTLASTWSFASTRADAQVTNVTYTAPGGATTDLPDVTVRIPCGNSGALSDWNGTFTQRWACLPLESGTATLTLTSGGAGTVQISDEDPPGSGDINTYSATAVTGNAHVLKGFFIGGPSGSTYREDFTWTLSPNGNRYTQISSYKYLEGPLAGTGGLCGGVARRN